MLQWELAAVPVIVIGGALLHFLFEQSGRCAFVGVFAPVNESPWEHLKMAYWPALAFTGVQAVATDPPAGIATAKIVAFTITAATLLGLDRVTRTVEFPSVAVEVGAHLATFTAAVMVVQLGGYGVERATTTGFGAGGFALLGLPAALFVIATFRPPRRSLFRDPITGCYGINRQARPSSASGPRNR
ncbi:MAG: DUF6512 family protein [Gordonia sp. (in: high G+C Gram-positive bacteria)]|uniref:DUF6512 family protein n=1 Tax=Gordonia sp. (in: high G+C Gram-positive bacteria) TaxID=84139 RepID=UPI0039E62849